MQFYFVLVDQYRQLFFFYLSLEVFKLFRFESWSYIIYKSILFNLLLAGNFYQWINIPSTRFVCLSFASLQLIIALLTFILNSLIRATSKDFLSVIFTVDIYFFIGVSLSLLCLLYPLFVLRYPPSWFYASTEQVDTIERRNETGWRVDSSFHVTNWKNTFFVCKTASLL